MLIAVSVRLGSLSALSLAYSVAPPPIDVNDMNKLARLDSNQECQYQKLVCYRLHHGLTKRLGFYTKTATKLG